MSANTQSPFKRFAQCEVVLWHIRRHVAILEEQQNPIDPSCMLNRLVSPGAL
jgi:hypothetical protein